MFVFSIPLASMSITYSRTRSSNIESTFLSKICDEHIAMYTALTRLGYQCQHTRETFQTNAFIYWAEAIKAKYDGKGRLYRPTEWHKLLGGYDVSFSLVLLVGFYFAH